MSDILKPDICVIGAGSGGLSVAAAAASFGVSVVLVEKGLMGGDCLNHGCVPSKALIAAGRHAQAMREGSAFGIASVEPTIEWPKVNDHVHGVIAAIAPNDSVERFTALGVRVIKEEARFADARTVVAGPHRIRARRVVVATGSRPAIPDISGIADVDALTNETIFSLRRRPTRLIIIGGGPIGLELAQAHRRLGCEVCVLEAGPRVLAREDRELTDIVVRRLRAEGVEMRTNAEIRQIERRGKTGVRVHLDSEQGPQTIDGSHLLVATGRRPALAGLDLDKAGIVHDGNGIRVNKALRTTNRRVYAIGDVAGAGQFTHLANYHAGLVLRAILFRLPVSQQPRIVPRVTFTDPEIAHVGLGEEEARASHKRIRVLRWPYAENDRAQAEHATEGFVKLVSDHRGRILGVSIVGAQAGELIAPWSLALARKLRVRDMVGHVLPYPTLGEIGKRAALSYFMETTRKPLLRGLLRFLRRFG